MLVFDKLPPTPKKTRFVEFIGESYVETGQIAASILLANNVETDSLADFAYALEKQVPLAEPNLMGVTVYKNQFVSGFMERVEQVQIDQGVNHE